jgi:hypothetical protein
LPDFAHDELKKASKSRDLLRSYSTKNGYPVIPWTDIQGNKFLNALHPAMLSHEGYHVFKMARITGQKQWEDKIQCFVFYDRDFVVQKLGIQLLDLRSAGFNEIQKAIGEAWQFCKQIEEDEEF